MQADARKVIQVLLLILMAAALLRLVWVFYERRAAEDPAAESRPAAPPLEADFYVRPRKLYLHDLESAQQLENKTVWVREGFRYTFYPYDARRRRADFGREAGLLPPLAELEITEVVRQPDPRGRGHQVVAAFRRDGEAYALPIGTHNEGSYQIYADEVFFYDDPRELYKHWPDEVWQSIEKGEVRTGMNEFQVAFAAGMGMPEPSTEPDTKVVRYPRGDDPVTVVYRNGRAVEVR